MKMKMTLDDLSTFQITGPSNLTLLYFNGALVLAFASVDKTVQVWQFLFKRSVLSVNSVP